MREKLLFVSESSRVILRESSHSLVSERIREWVSECVDTASFEKVFVRGGFVRLREWASERE